MTEPLDLNAIQAQAGAALTQACRRLQSELITSAHLLDRPFTNAPDQSPWTRVKAKLSGLHAAAVDVSSGTATLLARVRDLEAERDRYRTAWHSARRRGRNLRNENGTWRLTVTATEHARTQDEWIRTLEAEVNQLRDDLRHAQLPCRWTGCSYLDSAHDPAGTHECTSGARIWHCPCELPTARHPEPAPSGPQTAA
ncbi:hypothetical protein ACIQOW_03595 [Kitasatospora sp. NPDC091335]|uniref:hypothetical protein n=1 Tax=Kitasatospora sp. NPDC091335 TaxID=3364085 RepID=UPI0037F96E52